MRNVEIKARVHDIEELLRKAGEISKSKATIILQEDTFFKCENGRLKLRKFQDGSAELIFYDRPDAEGPKLSKYEKCNIQLTEVDGLKEVLNKALGTTGNVKKTRHLFMVGKTRVHVDQVDGLGSFMELEVGLMDNQTEEDGEKIAKDLMKELGIADTDLVPGAYMDLLNQS